MRTATTGPLAPLPRPVLSLAVESIVEAEGLPGTLVDVVQGRAFRHYREGLRQYLALRLGHLPAAERALAELRALAAAAGAEELVSPPGIRARLYRHARRIAEARATELDADPTSLPWFRPRTFRPSAARRLAALRTELTERERELLELRHSRELSPEEMAFVLGEPVEGVLHALDRATEQALGLMHGCGAADSVPSLGRALVEAFALETEAGTGVLEGNAWEAFPVGTVIGGRYAIESRVGTGAFGDVYRAKDTEVRGHIVALKILHQPARSEQARATALRELHLIASVFHPSIVQFKDHGWHEGRLWFVMPWYEGETLESRIERRPLGRAEAQRIFQPLSRALATMHAAGIRHQDIKPDNIFLARIRGFGRDAEDEVLPVLLDLGVAAKEAEMVVAGTPTYFAPEVAAQFARVDRRPPVSSKADVFSLALALRNALEPATQDEVAGGAVETFIEYRARHEPSVPEGGELRFLGTTFERWLSLDPEERPDADQLAEELAILTRPEERRRRLVGVLRWALPLIVTLSLLFVSVAYWLNARAERQKVEAQRARMAEAGLRKDLRATREERRNLEASVREVRERYARSRMSKQQLASRLALVEASLSGAEEAKEKLTSRLADVRRDLETARADASSLRDRLATASEDLSEERAAGKRVRGELAELRTEAHELDRRLTERIARVETLESQLGAERAKADRLAADLTEAIESRATLERNVRRLERDLARLESAPAAREPTSPVEPTEPSGPPSETPAVTEPTGPGDVPEADH